MIADNVRHVLSDIADTALRCGRDPREITLVAVSKTRTVGEVEQALAAGILHLGENRVQEAECKIPEVGGRAEWHLVGHLQSNKARKAAALFQWIDSVDSVKLADLLSDEAMTAGKRLDILVQVNISGESAKSGVEPEEAADLAAYAASKNGLRLRGLMTIGSLDASEDVIRHEFARMRALFDRLRGDLGMDVLSMGMSGDFRIAVEEGSTMVRIGTAVFGERL